MVLKVLVTSPWKYTIPCVTQICKLKIQQGDNGNLVAENGEANAQEYLSETHDKCQQNWSLTVAKQPFILDYSSAAPNNHQKNSSSAVVN